MKTVTGRIPLAGVYPFHIVVDDDMTDKQIFEKLESDFNNSATNTKLYSAMITGSIVQFPLTFAVIDKVEK